ncbi:hypothetical protein GLYMA_08G060200v4 [Glycine max]|uniref:JmjC domain-containing protein n=1 Tax=Glycine max TaxID=3847 RepID=A0A0R0IHT9_SOYBN|nr:hypothetical protein GYH30_020389 [Glycine max]KRH41946.1 hypothetical protein GLYMA_08G060200v4 [Glycine max]
MSKTPKEKETEEPLPDHLRCGRTDGRQWRCRRRVKENLKLCEIHYLQGRHRQYKEKVPESLKLQRKRKSNNNNNNNNEEEEEEEEEEKPEPDKKNVLDDNVESRARRTSRIVKKKRMLSEDSDASASSPPARKKALKQGDMQLELLRMVLKREAEKNKNKSKSKNKKNNNKKKNKKKEKRRKEEKEELCYTKEELRRELPNGVMEISPASPTRDYNNVGSHCDVKVGVDSKTVTPRYFRSKNVDRVPAGKLQIVPYGSNLKKGKRKKCHWCQRSESGNLIQCSSCQREFFCMDCVKERYFDAENEIKKACPVCRGTCPCKYCSASQCKDSESKECLTGKSRVDRILHFHYLICMLLPVLKQISEDQNIELETEVKIKGKNISDIQIKQVEFGCSEKNYCNHCKTPILDLHRSCPSCSYSLCSSCCQELSQGKASGAMNSSVFKRPDKMKPCSASENHTLEERATSIGNLTDTSVLPEWTNGNGIDSLSCPPTELGGCGKSHLELRSVFPSSWIKEMEAKAEEIVCSYDFPETSDKSSSCSLCFDTDHVMDISGDNFEHFQKHWGKGHPIVVQDALRSTSNLSWDPLTMFCTYLEQSITRYENNKNLLESCLDWWEVEINIKQYFTGSVKRRPQRNTWDEMLKLKGWLSSQIFKEQFPAHFAEVIDALPVQEYMHPLCGLLNLAANLPHGSAKHDIGPYVYISYGSADKETDSVTKLCYDSYDVVNIMTHTTDAPLSTEQLTKIRKLLKKHKTLCQMETIATEEPREQKLNGMALLHGPETERKGSWSMVEEGMNFFRRVNRTSCISTEAKKVSSQSMDSNGECDFISDSDSGSTLLLLGTVQTAELSKHNNPRNPFESSKRHKKKFTEHLGAQWDVFRRQDVPKLIEYLKRHYAEFSYTHDYDKKMVHPILDQSIFLDSTHKKRLKEEFKIEPWTFQQHVGQAVIIPAGCPYQMRNSKSSVHAVLEFVSPENVTEGIQLIDEVRLLPEDHKAKADLLEVKKMALHSMNTAIKEVRQLTSKT